MKHFISSEGIVERISNTSLDWNRILYHVPFFFMRMTFSACLEHPEVGLFGLSGLELRPILAAKFFVFFFLRLLPEKPPTLLPRYTLVTLEIPDVLFLDLHIFSGARTWMSRSTGNTNFSYPFGNLLLFDTGFRLVSPSI